MAAFFNFNRKYKHHEWTKGFCDISYSYEIIRAGLAWSNFHSSNCTSLCIFDWLVIELFVAKLVAKCWQRHIWINSTAKSVFYRSAAAFFGHTTNYIVANKGKPSNFHSSNCTSLCIFDWLVIELFVAKLVAKCWQRHIWINSTAKSVFYRSAAAFFGHTTNYIVANKGKPSTITSFNLLPWSPHGNGGRMYMYTWKHTYLLLKNCILQK